VMDSWILVAVVAPLHLNLLTLSADVVAHWHWIASASLAPPGAVNGP
jgi:hypothetical protein